VSSCRIFETLFLLLQPLLGVILSHRDIDIKFVTVFSVDPEDIRKAIPPKLWLTCTEMQSDSILLSGFMWPVIFKPYVPRKARMLKLFSILQD
jgi:hypothetical protein